MAAQPDLCKTCLETLIISPEDRFSNVTSYNTACKFSPFHCFVLKCDVDEYLNQYSNIRMGIQIIFEYSILNEIFSHHYT